MSTAITSSDPLLRDYQLHDNIWAMQGRVMLSGTQALVRLMQMQRQHDAALGWNTRGFISGYRGSPLGMVDQVVWKQGQRLKEAGIEFVPAINEELGATQVLGTQRVESDPERTVDGVFGMWYGKGPGVDRASDALKHGHVYGSSPHGGVLVVAGDDHGCVSSSMPHQSDQAFLAWHMPIVSPADVSELVGFGLYGFALSRYSGAWVGMTALSEVVESTATVDIDALRQQAAQWHKAEAVRAQTGHAPPADGLHYRWPDLPSLRLETRLQDKLDAVLAFARVNSINRTVIAAPKAHIGIITAGKAHHDVMEVCRRLGLSLADLEAAGVRWLKLGLTYPLEPQGIMAFCLGLREVLVIEEKGPIVEQQLRDLFYNHPADTRPCIVGKRDAQGQAFISAWGELRPSRLMMPVAQWLQSHVGKVLNIPLLHLPDFLPPAMHSNASDALRRLPYFCAGCPHNTSTRVPTGSSARAGIGCHFMANWMERDTAGLIQMGGEGVDWVSHARFTRTPHVFQNLGDGTYYHSGYLAIRQAVAAHANITYKILYNDAVAMTGGQPVDGTISVDAIARQVESEGVVALVVVSDDIGKYQHLRARFPAMTQFAPREDLDQVQQGLREVKGVSVLIYEQTCAAEKRRRRKKGELADPARRLMIHQDVCEGCGDCGQQSNCVAVLPQDTPWGRKRRIDQSVCNKDYSCERGFCPSFVSVEGGRLRRKAGASAETSTRLLAQAAALPLPHIEAGAGPWDLLITGVGGTGVVTVGAVIAMAAHLEGQHASVLDFMGFAQKGGSVLSFVRLARDRSRLHQYRIDTQQADAVLACDAVVAAAPDALQTIRHGRTRVLVNTHITPVADMVRHPDMEVPMPLLLDKLRHAAGEGHVEGFDAQSLTAEVLGDTQTANILALGYAWQRGLVPVGLAALEQALKLNGVAVEANLFALHVGRLAAQGHALDITPAPAASPQTLDAFLPLAHAHLHAWQDAAWAARYTRFIDEVRQQLQGHGAVGEQWTLTVAHNLHKLMTYKDEYEVARLYAAPSFSAQLHTQFEGDYRLRFHFAPPVLSTLSNGTTPRKRSFGAWVLPLLRVLQHGKRVRGTVLDVFGHTAERRLERQLISDYETLVREMLAHLKADAANVDPHLVQQVLALPQQMRGFGHVKERHILAARYTQAQLLHRLWPARYPAPLPQAPSTGSFKGIAIHAV